MRIIKLIKTIVNQRDCSSGTLIALILVIALWLAFLPFVKFVQQATLNRYHLQTGSFSLWAIQQVIPAIYNFENEYFFKSDEETPDPEIIEFTKTKMINHFPLRVITYYNSRYILFHNGNGGDLTVRSHYQDLELETHWRIRCNIRWPPTLVPEIAVMKLASAIIYTPGEQHRLLILDRVVSGGILVSLLLKMGLFFVGFVVYRQLRLADDFFPVVLQNPYLFLSLYVSAIFLCALVWITRQRTRHLWLKSALSACLLSLCLHQQTYNDVTFLTCFWASIWSLWFSTRVGKDSEQLLRDKGALFAQLIISLVFLGGVVGKFTPGYWNGSVLFEIYFEHRNFWIYNFLREQFSEPQLERHRQMAFSSCYPDRVCLFVAVAVTASPSFPPGLGHACNPRPDQQFAVVVRGLLHDWTCLCRADWSA